MHAPSHKNKTMKRILITLLCLCFCGMVSAQTGTTPAKKNTKVKTEKHNKEATEKLEAIPITQEEFAKKIFDYNDTTQVYKGKKPVIIDFYADWCGPCKRLAPVLDQLLKEYDGAFLVYKINVDHNKDLARALQVYNIPTLLYLAPKQKAKRSMGLLTKDQLKEIIDKYLIDNKNK